MNCSIIAAFVDVKLQPHYMMHVNVTHSNGTRQNLPETNKNMKLNKWKGNPVI
jgi:hypothetical protein